MPPVLDPESSKVDGLAFLGLSLTRKSRRGHAGSATHQQAFDLDLVQDREYQHVFSSNDDGWLVGGGEPGPPKSYKLEAKDSAHVELMRIGTFQEEWGGVPQEWIVETLRRGEILIPEITVVPTEVVANGDTPPELEIRFDMIPRVPNFDLDSSPSAPLPLNWQLRFVQNQLFHKFKFASRFTPGAFHSTILRKAEFRSQADRDIYFSKCRAVCQKWIGRGAKPLAPPPAGSRYGGLDPSIEVVKCLRREPKKTKLDSGAAEDANSRETGLTTEDESRTENQEGEDEEYYRSGLWLFTDRNTITHQFLPNFLPPYDTPIKKKLILEVLKEEWDERNLCWKPLTTQFDPPVPPKARDTVVEEEQAATQETEPADKKEPVEPVPEAEPQAQEQAPPPPPPPPPAPPVQQQREAPKPSMGILDPNDDIGFTHFVASFGTEMANMAGDLCGPMTSADKEAATKQPQQRPWSEENATGRTEPPTDNGSSSEEGVSGEELLAGIEAKKKKSNANEKKNGEKKNSSKTKPKVVITGKRVNKNQRRRQQQQQEVIDMTGY